MKSKPELMDTEEFIGYIKSRTYCKTSIHFQKTHLKPETTKSAEVKNHSIPVTPSICKNGQILRMYNIC